MKVQLQKKYSNKNYSDSKKDASVILYKLDKIIDLIYSLLRKRY